MTAKNAEPATKRLQVRVRLTTHKALEAIARKEMLPMAAVVRRILDNHVAGLEAEATQDDGGVSWAR